MKQPGIALLCLLILVVLPLSAQHKVDPRNTYERALAVVPIVGSGTPADPRRPMYAPVPHGAPSRDGIVAFTWQISDDGRSALVEFVARDHAGLQAILDVRGTRSDVTIFEKGKDSRQDIEAEFRKHKKDFDLDQFGVRLP